MPIPVRAYVFRAYYEWIIDSGLSPYVLADVNDPEVVVPAAHVQFDGKILLDLSTKAIRNLHISRYYLEFDTSFSGEIFAIVIPMRCLHSLFAKENAEGIFFNDNFTYEKDDVSASILDNSNYPEVGHKLYSKKRRKVTLKLISEEE